jgi:hypothetical protein
MDLFLVIICAIGALIGGIVIGYKTGRGVRRDKYEASVSARNKAQQALSTAQATNREMEEKVPFLLLELPSSQYDEEKRRTDQEVKRLEDSVLQLVEPIEEAKQLQARRFKTSPDIYSLNSEQLKKLTEHTHSHIHSLVKRVEDLGVTVNALKPENLSVSLERIQKRNIDRFKSYVRKTEIKSGSSRNGNFAKQVALAQRTADAIHASIDAGKEDRYVLKRKIEQLEQDCNTLWDLYIQLNPDAQIFQWMDDYFEEHPEDEFVDD